MAIVEEVTASTDEEEEQQHATGGKADDHTTGQPTHAEQKVILKEAQSQTTETAGAPETSASGPETTAVPTSLESINTQAPAAAPPPMGQETAGAPAAPEAATQAVPRDATTETSAKEAAAKEETDPADIPPKIHFENNRFALAKEGWSRQVRSCTFVLEKMAKAEESGYTEDGEEVKIDEAKKKEYSDLRLKARLNLALVSIKLGDFTQAVKYAEEVLEEQPDNQKALYRRALGLFESGLILEAARAISDVSDSDDVAVVRLRQQIERQLARKRLVEKRMMQGVLEGEESGGAPTRLRRWLPTSRMGVLAVAVGCCSVVVGTMAWWSGSSRGGLWWRQMLARKE